MRIDVYMAADLVTMLRALADPTRLRLLNLLADKGDICVCDLERALEAGQPHVSRHLAYLKHAGWVQPRRERTWVFYSLRRDLGESATMILRALQMEWGRNEVFRADQERLAKLIKGGSCHPIAVSGNSQSAREVTND